MEYNNFKTEVLHDLVDEKLLNSDKKFKRKKKKIMVPGLSLEKL